jgi:hypothetical protein
MNESAADPARGLINSEPDADSCRLEEGEVVGCEFVVMGGGRAGREAELPRQAIGVTTEP